MTRIIAAAVALLMTAFIACACVGETEYSDTEGSLDVLSNTESQEVSEEASEEASESVSDTETSEDAYEKKYPFLKSEYVITSKIMTGETVFVCKYYFVDKKVAGAKLMTTFDDTKTAKDYYDIILDDYPDAKIDRLTVTHFLADDDNYFYGYSPEKLKFALETAGYAVSVGFDIDEFYKDESDAVTP